MGFGLKCLEHVVGLACGCVTLATHHPDPSIAVVGAVSAAALIAVFGEENVRTGPESERALAKVRAAILADLQKDVVFRLTAPADLNAADEALKQSLGDCMLDRTLLAQSAVHPDGFPKNAAALVVGELEKRHNRLFGRAGTDGPANQTCRDFARRVIETALSAAFDDRDYFARFQPHLLAAIAQGIGRVETQVDAVKTKVDEVDSKVDKLTAMVLEKLAPAGNDQSQRLAPVEAEVAKAIDRDPTLAGGDIVRQIVNLISSREDALRELAAISPEDKRVRAIQAAAEEAIASSDNSGALLALQEARAALGGRRESDARLSAKYAAAQAELLLGEGKWQEADTIWYEAGALLEPFDLDAAEDVFWKATSKLFNFGDSFANPDALVRSYIRCKSLLEICDADKDAKKWAKRTIFSCVIVSSVSSLSDESQTHILRYSALKALTKVFSIIDIERDYDEWLQATCTLGTLYALQAERVRVSGERDDAYIIAKNAAETFEIALSAMKDASDAAQRANIACGLGHACLIQGLSADTQENGLELFSKSMRALQYADSLVTENDHPTVWAKVQMNAGCTLLEASKWVEKEIRAKLAFDAVSALRASLRIYSEFKTPNDWAQAQFCLGGALMNICQRSEGPDWEKLKLEGLEAFDAALRVWNSEKFAYGYDTVLEHRAKLSTMKPADSDI